MDFSDRVELQAREITAIQVNIGYTCNLNCTHCYVKASPNRSEIMEWPLMEMVIDALGRSDITMVDITGGAPELNPNLKRFIAKLSALKKTIQVRTNLAVLSGRDMATLPEFYREHNVQLVASMPCYLKENVDGQRGDGTYEKNITILNKLNKLGYGTEAGLTLNLVYNPGIPALPPDQTALEADYKRELFERFGIRFNKLLTITNMPIGRFRDDLVRNNTVESYMKLLMDSFNPETLQNIMCLHQLNVGWDGSLYDCDFNQILGLQIQDGPHPHISEFEPGKYIDRKIVTGNHCFGCTAGAGSSCRGALV